jgi:TolB-like protein
MGRLLVCAALLCSLLVAEAVAEADKPAVAMIGFDALGMDEERVQRLETLFLKELERLTGKRVPNRRSVARLKKKLRNCDGGNKCLGAIGKALSVDFVVSGNVASLGDSYILNIKAVASKSGAELRRIESDPLRGQPDELIDAIRVAAYRLLAPDELVGSITVLADRAGAVVELDSKVIGKTPLTKPIEGLTLGEHQLRVSAGEFGEFSSKVRVRFQKATRVVVNLVDLRVKADPDPNAGLHLVNQDRPKRWYQKTWFLASAGVGVGVLGAIIGYTLAKTDIISCPERPECTP